VDHPKRVQANPCLTGHRSPHLARKHTYLVSRSRVASRARSTASATAPITKLAGCQFLYPLQVIAEVLKFLSAQSPF
jgi:hypothetical protein